MKKNEREESLGTRLKGYEKDFESNIDAKDYIVCRIDGHKFSKYTKKMRKPFDTILSSTMTKTTEDLVEKFGAVTGYTQSDEITLIFAPQYKIKLNPVTYDQIDIFDEKTEYKVYDREDNYLGYIETIFDEDEEGYHTTRFYVTDGDGQTVDQCVYQCRNKMAEKNTEEMFSKYLIKEVEVKNEQIFGGRIQKMASLIASFTTMKFNKNFAVALEEQQVKEPRTPKNFEYFNLMQEKVGNAWFDARLYGVDCKEEAFNSLMWRVRDAEKNSRSMFAQTYCSHKSLLNKNGPEQVAFCLAETGKDWNDIDMGYKYGVIAKREEYQKTVNLDRIQVFSDVETVTRTRTTVWADALTSFSEESVDLIVRKLK